MFFLKHLTQRSAYQQQLRFFTPWRAKNQSLLMDATQRISITSKTSEKIPKPSNPQMKGISFINCWLRDWGMFPGVRWKILRVENSMSHSFDQTIGMNMANTSSEHGGDMGWTVNMNLLILNKSIPHSKATLCNLELLQTKIGWNEVGRATMRNSWKLIWKSVDFGLMQTVPWECVLLAVAGRFYTYEEIWVDRLNLNHQLEWGLPIRCLQKMDISYPIVNEWGPFSP